MDQDPLRKERVEEHLLEELGELESAVAQKRASEQPQLAPSAESEEVLEAEVVAENSSESTYRNNLRKLLCNIDHTSALLDEVKSLYDILIGNLDAYSVEDDAGLDRVQAALTQAKASKEALFTLTPLLPREAEKSTSAYALDPLLLVGLQSENPDQNLILEINLQIVQFVCACFDHLYQCMVLISIPDPSPPYAKMHHEVFGIASEIFTMLADYLGEEDKLADAVLGTGTHRPTIAALEQFFERRIE